MFSPGVVFVNCGITNAKPLCLCRTSAQLQITAITADVIVVICSWMRLAIVLEIAAARDKQHQRW